MWFFRSFINSFRTFPSNEQKKWDNISSLLPNISVHFSVNSQYLYPHWAGYWMLKSWKIDLSAVCWKEWYFYFINYFCWHIQNSLKARWVAITGTAINTYCYSHISWKSIPPYGRQGVILIHMGDLIFRTSQCPRIVQNLSQAH